MEQELLWSSETEVFVGLKTHRNFFEEAYRESIEISTKLHEQLVLEHAEKMKSGGRYTLVFSIGSRKRKIPFVNFYLNDESKGLLMLSTQEPFRFGENIMPVSSDEIFNSLYRLLLNVFNKRCDDLIMKGAILAKAKFSAALEVFGDLKLFRKEILKESLENENNLSLFLNSNEKDIETILKDWACWKESQDGKTKFFVQPYNKQVLIFLKFPEFLLKYNDNLVFEIARYFRDRLSEKSDGVLTGGYLPQGLSVSDKILTIFSLNILDYPKFSEKIGFFSESFVEKVSKVLEHIEAEVENLQLFGGE